MNSHRIAFIFPGQGAQYPGMGKDFAERFSAARHTFEEADDILKRNLSSIIWNGPESVLTETKNSQTGIYVTSIALLRIFEEQFPHLKPYVCAGLSLGEYSAMTAAKKWQFQEGLQLVDKRSEFMNDACLQKKGTMAVVMGLDPSVVEETITSMRLPGDIWIANLNCPGQVVISGTIRGIEEASNQLKCAGAKRVLPLQVFGAFHSGLMEGAKERLVPFIQNTVISATPERVVMNVPGDFVDDPQLMKRHLIDQVVSPVKWELGVRAMMREGVDLFIEVGCGKTLSGMNKRIGTLGKTLSLEKIEDLDLIAKEI